MSEERDVSKTSLLQRMELQDKLMGEYLVRLEQEKTQRAKVRQFLEEYYSEEYDSDDISDVYLWKKYNFDGTVGYDVFQTFKDAPDELIDLVLVEKQGTEEIVRISTDDEYWNFQKKHYPEKYKAKMDEFEHEQVFNFLMSLVFAGEETPDLSLQKKTEWNGINVYDLFDFQFGEKGEPSNGNFHAVIFAKDDHIWYPTVDEYKDYLHFKHHNKYDHLLNDGTLRANADFLRYCAEKVEAELDACSEEPDEE